MIAVNVIRQAHDLIKGEGSSFRVWFLAQNIPVHVLLRQAELQIAAKIQIVSLPFTTFVAF